MTWFTSLLDLPLDAVQVDMRYAFDAQRPGARALEYWARFGAGISEQDLRDMVTWVENGCFTTSTIRAAVPVRPHLRLNGVEVPYTPSSTPPSAVLVSGLEAPSFEVDGTVRVVETYWREATTEGFSFNADEAVSRAGTSKALSPLGYFLLGIGFGIGNQAVASARVLDFPLDGFQIEVETAYDARSTKLMRGDAYVGQLWLAYHLDVQSAEGADRAIALADSVFWSCRTLDTLRQPVEMVSHIVLNGREIAFELPPLHSPEAAREFWAPRLAGGLPRFKAAAAGAESKA